MQAIWSLKPFRLAMSRNVPITRFILSLTLTFALTGCGNRELRGRFVQKEDPTIYIEFFGAKRARSNIVKEFGDAEYWFSNSSTLIEDETRLSGPLNLPKSQQRYFEVLVFGEELRIQELVTKPDSRVTIPIGNFTRKATPPTAP